MRSEHERARTASDAGAKAVALFRKIDEERAANPMARPGGEERFIARLIDSVPHVLVILVILLAYSALFVSESDAGLFASGSGGSLNERTAAGELTGATSLGLVAVKLATVLTLLVCVAAIAIIDVLQTWAFGATWGKLWIETRVHRMGGRGPASLMRIGVRGALLAVPFVIVAGFWFESVLYAWTGIAILAVVWVRTTRDSRQQGLHDKIAGTELYSTDVRN